MTLPQDTNKETQDLLGVVGGLAAADPPLAARVVEACRLAIKGWGDARRANVPLPAGPQDRHAAAGAAGARRGHRLEQRGADPGRLRREARPALKRPIAVAVLGALFGSFVSPAEAAIPSTRSGRRWALIVSTGAAPKGHAAALARVLSESYGFSGDALLVLNEPEATGRRSRRP
jgi:hypothetical protein